MPIHNYGQKRKCVMSIEAFELLFDKETYPVSTCTSRKITIDGEEIRYYCSIYHRAFIKGRACEGCGLKGAYYALERNGSCKAAYRLNLYGTDDNNIDVLLTGHRPKQPPRNGVDNIKLMCIRCIVEIDQAHNIEQKKATIEKNARYNEILAKMKINSLDNFKEIKKDKVVLFDGTLVNASNVVAYCNNATHYGWISKNLMKKHKCIEKECPYMEKANPTYWINKEVEKIKRGEARKKEKEVENQTRERNDYIRSTFLQYDDVYVTSIREEKGQLQISYIYDNFVDLTEAIRKIKLKYKLPVYLKAVRCSELNTQILIRNRKNLNELPVLSNH